MFISCSRFMQTFHDQFNLSYKKSAESKISNI